ncbi:MAG TPA: IclR family transcriptional regulator [Candidatus Acidoferrum sp.]|jgi:DNA-binding IclR family transcriptional regulator|nr:IclR family transcriptional regulator [Candidatus Acidoferrum sp.]
MAKTIRPATGLSDDAYRVPAVERAFVIIRALAAGGPLSLAEVVEESALNKSTAFYILRTLVTLDVVAYEEGTRAYTLGPALMELGMIARGQFSDVAVAKRHLAELLDVMNVTIAIYRRVDLGEVMMVDKLERPRRVRITVQYGERLPIQGGSTGRAFLAYDDPLTLDQVLKDGLHKFTAKSVTRVPAFRNELTAARERGWAVDREGFALGVTTVAAPIFGPDGKVALVASAVDFTSLVTDEVAQEYGQHLRRACDRIGQVLGATLPSTLAV